MRWSTAEGRMCTKCAQNDQRGFGGGRVRILVHASRTGRASLDFLRLAGHSGHWRDSARAEEAALIAHRMARMSMLSIAGLVSVHDHTQATDSETRSDRWANSSRSIRPVSSSCRRGRRSRQKHRLSRCAVCRNCTAARCELNREHRVAGAPSRAAILVTNSPP